MIRLPNGEGADGLRFPVNNNSGGLKNTQTDITSFATLECLHKAYRAELRSPPLVPNGYDRMTTPEASPEYRICKPPFTAAEGVAVVIVAPELSCHNNEVIAPE